MSIAIVNLVDVAISPGMIALEVAGVADGEGATFEGRDKAFAFQSGVVVRSLGVSEGSSANAPTENAQSPRDSVACKNRIRARMHGGPFSIFLYDDMIP